MKESAFQRNLKKELEETFDGCVILKMDSSQIQGVPDLLILHNDKWATLENKKSENASHRPNQEYYVDKMNKMSFSRFVYPENKNEVISDLKNFFG